MQGAAKSALSRRRVVVMVDTIARPGGGERLAVENAIRLDPARYERSFCITRWDDRLERIENIPDDDLFRDGSKLRRAEPPQSLEVVFGPRRGTGMSITLQTIAVLYIPLVLLVARVVGFNQLEP